MTKKWATLVTFFSLLEFLFLCSHELVIGQRFPNDICKEQINEVNLPIIEHRKRKGYSNKINILRGELLFVDRFPSLIVS